MSHAVKREIKEIEKGTDSRLLDSRLPKHLWDGCLELVAFIRSNNAHNIYKVDREEPQVRITDETSVMS